MKNVKLILCVIAISFAMCISAFAMSGSGTETDPYLVSSASDIALVHNDLDGYYKLTADIDMAGVSFEPIGNENEGAFSGTIDGNGHTISNLDINLPGNKYVGFVGYLEGTVKNLNLENVDACGYKYVGGLVGYVEKNSRVENCEISGSITGEYVISSVYIGGVSGYNTGVINNCFGNETINAGFPSSDASFYIGGISGYNSGTINQCISNGDLFAKRRSYHYLGGIAGENNRNISSCTNFSRIWSNNSFYALTGGICGINRSEIESCTNYGDILVDDVTGFWAYVGGIVGKNSNGSVSRCYNASSVISKNNEPDGACGGIAGYSYDSLITECKNIGEIINDDNRTYCGGIVGFQGNSTPSYSDHNVEFGIEKCVNGGKITGSYSGAIAGVGFGNRDRKTCSINICINYGVSSASRIENYFGFTQSDRWGVYFANSTRENLNFSNATYCSDLPKQYQYLSNKELDILEFTEFDFENIWYIDEKINSGLPTLRNMPRHIDLNECVLLLKVGETAHLEAFIDGVTESVTWSSEDGSIATVSSDGTVNAIATGDIMITATNAEGMKANCLVHITKDVSAVTLNKSATQITAGSSETLTYQLNPVDANEVVIWSSSDETVATVDQNGVVSAKAKGTATITVTTVTSNKSASCEVTVVGAPISSVSLPYSASVNRGMPYKLAVTVNPTQYAGTLSWSSSDETVATVDQDGVVTGLKAGNTVITVRSDNGKTATCTVTVNIPSTGLTLNKPELTIESGMTDKLVATFTPQDTTDIVYWSSSSSCVSVSSDGTLTANSPGRATITARTTSGLEAYCFVTITAAKVPVSSVTLNNTELIMTKADTKQLTATVLPTSATDKSLTWTTSDSSVATVSNTGVVTAVGDGVAILTATSNNGMYHECVVKVISASGPSVVLTGAKASPGGTAIVKARIVKNPGISAYKFTVNYDSTKLTPVSITSNTEFGGTFTTNLEDTERTELNVLWHSTKDVDTNGELFTVEFDVSESAQYGDCAAVSVTYGGTDICNTNGDYIALYTDSAVIDIKEPTPGDVYEDEDVNVYDLTLLARYITFLEDFTARQQEAGDVNNDKLVDIKDVVKLSQYLVGWSGATLMSETATIMSYEKPETSVGTASVNASGEVVIPVSIKHNPGITGLNYKIDYSKDKLEIISITPNTELLASNFITNLGYEDERGLAVTWHQNDNMTSDGILFTITAKLKDGFDVGAITIVPADNNMCNQDGENVVAAYTDGYVLAESYVVEEYPASNDNFTCNMYFDDTFTEQSATAIVAFYNGTKFVKMASAPITVKEGKVAVTIPCEEVSYTTYKVLVWQDLVSMKPLVEVKQN